MYHTRNSEDEDRFVMCGVLMLFCYIVYFYLRYSKNVIWSTGELLWYMYFNKTGLIFIPKTSVKNCG